MKYIVVVFLSGILLFVSNTASSNVLPDVNINSCEMQDAGFGNLVTSLANGLKPTAFSKEWKTQSATFLHKMKSQSAIDLTGSASSLFEFYKLLNPKVFVKEWKTEKGTFLKGVSEVKSAEDLSKLFLMLVNGISPNYFTKEFKAKADAFKQSVGQLGMN